MAWGSGPRVLGLRVLPRVHEVTKILAKLEGLELNTEPHLTLQSPSMPREPLSAHDPVIGSRVLALPKLGFGSETAWQPDPRLGACLGSRGFSKFSQDRRAKGGSCRMSTRLARLKRRKQLAMTL